MFVEWTTSQDLGSVCSASAKASQRLASSSAIRSSCSVTVEAGLIPSVTVLQAVMSFRGVAAASAIQVAVVKVPSFTTSSSSDSSRNQSTIAWPSASVPLVSFAFSS